jgi:uncharacterized membrane protein YidH (DUF202 family)
MSLHHWLIFIAAFLIVIGILSVAVGAAEWWKWQRRP